MDRLVMSPAEAAKRGVNVLLVKTTVKRG
jgi:hypothetical protein